MPTNLNVAELDFNLIKESLKDYLRNQSEFQDFDFDGAGLSILLDVLSYNQHYHGFYANMLHNEGFLDSAVTRNSIVSHAKELGYTPRSITAAKATVDITITTNDVLPNIVIPRGSEFTSEIDGVTYNFVTTQAYIANPVGGNQYVAEDVQLVQGTYLTFSYTVDDTNPEQKFLVQNTSADTDTLIVAVQTSPNDTTAEVYTRVTDINLVDSDTKAYFLQEIEDGDYQVYFGDGIVGYKPKDGNVVILEYLTTKGPDANGAAVFTSAGDINGYSNIDVTTTIAASGGALRETEESIRFNAPLFYQAQNRLVTEQDYRTLLAQNATVVDNANSIAVWGGEENVPAIYGKVFISLNPRDSAFISEALKQQIIEEVIDGLNVVTITPEIVDAEFLYIIPTVNFKYDASKTTRSQGELVQLVTQTISDYNDNQLEFFDTTFRYSNLSCLIDDTEESIISNTIDILMKKKQDVNIGVATQYQVRFENAIKPGTLTTNAFTINEPTAAETDQYFLRDDGVGNIVLYKRLLDQTTVVIDAEHGTIDYDGGIIDLPRFMPTSILDGTTVNFIAEPAYHDLESVRNLILIIDSADVGVIATGVTAR